MNSLLNDIPLEHIKTLPAAGETSRVASETVPEVTQDDGSEVLMVNQHSLEKNRDRRNSGRTRATRRSKSTNRVGRAASFAYAGRPATLGRYGPFCSRCRCWQSRWACGCGNFRNKSPYMDEASNIITGRMLAEQGKVYANALEWSYGSVLYPIMVGWFDQQAGLTGARTLSLLAGLVTVFSTIVMTLGLFKAQATGWRKSRSDLALTSKPMIAALLAGLLVAILPTAIGISRFATYDATAAGFFAAGCAAFAWARRVVLETQREGKKEWGLSVGLFRFVGDAAIPGLPDQITS